jgi:hypothetical protein
VPKRYDIYTPRFVREQVKLLRDITSTATEPEESVPETQAGIRLIRYLDLQLVRLDACAGGPNDLLALVVRNLLETLAWAKFVMRGSSEATQFLSEHAIDLKEIAKLSRVLRATSEVPESSVAAIEEAFLRVPGQRLQLKRSDSVEEVVFKLCSKYIHPSSWLLERLHRLENSQHRKLFCELALNYAHNIVHILGTSKAS